MERYRTIWDSFGKTLKPKGNLRIIFEMTGTNLDNFGNKRWLLYHFVPMLCGQYIAILISGSWNFLSWKNCLNLERSIVATNPGNQLVCQGFTISNSRQCLPQKRSNERTEKAVLSLDDCNQLISKLFDLPEKKSYTITLQFSELNSLKPLRVSWSIKIAGLPFYRTRVQSLAMLVTDSLTHSCLVNLIDVTLPCEQTWQLKLVEVVTVAWCWCSEMCKFGADLEAEVWS